jgi:hypothetical protein
VRSYLLEDTWQVPVLFSPEAQADGDWTDVHANAEAAIEAIPADLAAMLTDTGVFGDVVLDVSDALFTALGARKLFDPVSFSGTSGRYTHPFAMAVVSGATTGVIPGQTLLHELAHAIDMQWMRANGTPYGIDPVGSGGDLTPSTGYSYHAEPYADRVEWAQLNWGDLIISYTQYDIDGNVIDYIENALPSGFLRDEQTVRDLYPGTGDGNYYRSNVNEWHAQCLMLCIADHVAGYDSSAYDSLVSQIGGSSLLDDYRTWAESIGVLPASW